MVSFKNWLCSDLAGVGQLLPGTCLTGATSEGQHMGRLQWGGSEGEKASIWICILGLGCSLMVECVRSLRETQDSIPSIKTKTKAGDLAQWFSVCLAFMRPRVQSLVPQNKNKQTKKPKCFSHEILNDNMHLLYFIRYCHWSANNIKEYKHVHRSNAMLLKS
jgi:hypothetical protein